RCRLDLNYALTSVGGISDSSHGLAVGGIRARSAFYFGLSPSRPITLTSRDRAHYHRTLVRIYILGSRMPAELQSKYDQKLVHVLKTSAAVFAEKGYHSTSMRDISRATKMSLSGLYYYFKSKEELLFLIQDYCFSTVIGDCRRLLEGVEDPIRR